MNDQTFFEEPTEQSRIKAEIVSKYFWAWAKVMLSVIKRNTRRGPDRIAYIDLFAGKGLYNDGTPSTPILVLTKVIDDPEMRERLVTIFNDLNPEYAKSLQAAINAIPGIDRVKHQPKVINIEVGEKIAESFEQMNLAPTLFFVDPFGYKGLSLRLVNSVLKDWGCDCIFFFNYNRVNPGLDNPRVVEHMNALFGEQRADSLRLQLDGMNPAEREATIINELCNALQELGGKYVLPFCFKDETGHRTSHHLILVCKHVLGYGIMKDIMANYSSTSEQGVPSFMFSPPTGPEQLVLFELSRPLDDLAGMLLETFAGETMTVKDVFDQHNVGKPYVMKNYQKVLNELEAAGKVRINPPADKRMKRMGEITLTPKAIVIFPRKDVT